jgi:hypothetical protein
MRNGLLVLSLLLAACGASREPLAVSSPVGPQVRADELRMRNPDSLSRSAAPELGQLQLVPVGGGPSRGGTLTRGDHAAKRRPRAGMAKLEGLAK